MLISLGICSSSWRRTRLLRVLAPAQPRGRWRELLLRDKLRYPLITGVEAVVELKSVSPCLVELWLGLREISHSPKTFSLLAISQL